MIVYVICRSWAGAPIVVSDLREAARFIYDIFKNFEATSLEHIEAELKFDLEELGDDSLWKFTYFPEEGCEEYIQIYKTEIVD